MSSPPYLDPATERHLIAAAQAGDVAARNKLILACLPYLHRAVRHFAPGATADHLDDLRHEAVFALYEALDAYDLRHPKRPRLYVFASSRIRKVVARFFRYAVSSFADLSDLPDQPDWVHPLPDRALEAQQSVSQVRRALSSLSGLESHVLYSRRAMDPAPPRTDLAAQYGVSQQWIERVERRAAAKVASLLQSPLALHSHQ